MHKLKSLDNILLTESILKVLAQSKVNNILDFLREDAEKLSNLTKLTLPQVLAIRSEIFAKYSAPLINGTKILENSFIKRKIQKTGLECLDTILDGGLPIGYITEICGLAGSGKTQLCFYFAINCVKNMINTVLYIDTKGDFSAMRIQKILNAQGLSHKDMADIMFRIKVIHIWNLDGVIELLQKIKNKSLVFENLSLIIIDSLPCLMFQYLGDTNKIGLSRLNTFVNYCRFLCKEFKICIICVNIHTRWVDQDVNELDDENDQSTSKEPTYIEKQNRCLGKYWQYIPALIILIERSETAKPEDGKLCCNINLATIRVNSGERRHCSLNNLY